MIIPGSNSSAPSPGSQLYPWCLATAGVVSAAAAVDQGALASVPVRQSRLLMGLQLMMMVLILLLFDALQLMMVLLRSVFNRSVVYNAHHNELLMVV